MFGGHFSFFPERVFGRERRVWFVARELNIITYRLLVDIVRLHLHPPVLKLGEKENWACSVGFLLAVALAGPQPIVSVRRWHSWQRQTRRGTDEEGGGEGGRL